MTTLSDILLNCVPGGGRKTIVGVARVFGVSRQTVYRWLSDDAIPAWVALRILQLQGGNPGLVQLAPFVLELDG